MCCLFCGSEDVHFGIALYAGKMLHFVCCHSCRAQGPQMLSEDSAFSAWQRKLDQDDMQLSLFAPVDAP